MILYTVGNLTAAASQTYMELLLARVFTSFSHGAFSDWALWKQRALLIVPNEPAPSPACSWV